MVAGVVQALAVQIGHASQFCTSPAGCRRQSEGLRTKPTTVPATRATKPANPSASSVPFWFWMPLAWSSGTSVSLSGASLGVGVGVASLGTGTE